MERFLKIQRDSDYQPVKRQVRDSWGGYRIGATIEVLIASDTPTPQWVRCRIDRVMSGRYVVTQLAR